MGDCVLLTGATGQVGAAVLPRLLADPDTRVLALLRARDDAHFAARRQELLDGLPEGADRGRVDAVRGNVAAPGLLMDARTRERVLSEVDCVLHSAASVRFDLPMAQALAENLGGTENVLAMARELASRGRLRRLDHVSTAYVAGTRQGRVLETECDEGQAFRNSYEASKCRSEGRVRSAILEGLPAAIHRPAIVVGDSRTGETRSFNVLYWPLKLYARGWWRTFPGRADALVDLVPVDFVADAICGIRRRPESLGRCFHLACGDDAPDVGAVIARIRALTGGPPLRYVNQRFYRLLIRPLLWPLRLTRRGRMIFRGGNAFMPYMVSNPLFDTTHVRSLLGDAGRPPPALDYMERIVRYAVDRDFGGGR